MREVAFANSLAPTVRPTIDGLLEIAKKAQAE